MGIESNPSQLGMNYHVIKETMHEEETKKKYKKEPKKGVTITGGKFPSNFWI